MSNTVAAPGSPPVAGVAVPSSTQSFDADAQRRWQAWKARGLASERAFNRRMKVVAAVAVPLAVAALTTFLMRRS